MSSCKGCREEYRVTEAQIDRILKAPMFQSQELCVPDEVYKVRLEHCSDCTKLIDGKTCMVCGCFIRVATKLRDRACPHPANSRWSRYNGEAMNSVQG